MISLSIGDFFCVILLGGVTLIALLAWRLQNRRKLHDWHLTSRHLFQCDRCHLSFITERAVTLCRCPRCSAYCVKRRSK